MQTDDSRRKPGTEWLESNMLSKQTTKVTAAKQTPNPEDIYEKQF